jgi:hypothetical protein
MCPRIIAPFNQRVHELVSAPFNQSVHELAMPHIINAFMNKYPIQSVRPWISALFSQYIHKLVPIWSMRPWISALHNQCVHELKIQ